MFGAERYEEAAVALESATKLNPNDEIAFALLGATYGLLGRTQEAKASIARFNERWVERGSVPMTVSETACSLCYGHADQDQ